MFTKSQTQFSYTNIKSLINFLYIFLLLLLQALSTPHLRQLGIDDVDEAVERYLPVPVVVRCRDHLLQLLLIRLLLIFILPNKFNYFFLNKTTFTIVKICDKIVDFQFYFILYVQFMLCCVII